MADDPFYLCCARRAALRDHECKANPINGRLIEWEHVAIFAGRQVQTKSFIIPACWWSHSGPGLVKEIHYWIALNRATDDELFGMSKAVNYIAMRERLNLKYGPYIPAGSEAKIHYV